MFSIVSTLQPHRFHYLMLGLLGVWVLMHLPGILYGAHATPLHVTYVGDEQVSVNSALRTLNEKSILAFRNREMQYYGPMFVVLDTPGVVADFAIKYVTGVVHSAEEYKQYIIWDWGGIIRNIRLTALLSMLLGLVVVYKLAGTRTLNPSGSRYLPYLTTALLAVNFHFFEYSNFSIHWAYVLPLLFVQWYTLVRILETAGSEKKYWVAHAAAVVISFGVSYMSLIYLAMWWPALWTIWRTRDGVLFKKWLAMMGGTGLLSALIVWWHPYAFFRIISFMGIGAPMHNQGDAQNPFVLYHHNRSEQSGSCAGVRAVAGTCVAPWSMAGRGTVGDTVAWHYELPLVCSCRACRGEVRTPDHVVDHYCNRVPFVALP
jgi:hypothetical protein